MPDLGCYICFGEEELFRLCKFGAVGGACIFAGTALYAAFVYHPNSKVLGPSVSTSYLQGHYPKVKKSQIITSVTSGIAGLWAGRLALEYNKKLAAPFFAGGALMLSQIPYTLIIMKPRVLDYLLDPKVDKASQKTADTLENWAKFHTYRTISSCVAILLYLRGCTLVG